MKNHRDADSHMIKSYLYFFILSGPFLFFTTAISFETKNYFGGIGANLFLILLIPLVVNALFTILRSKKSELGLIVLSVIICFLLFKKITYNVTEFDFWHILKSTKEFIFFLVCYLLGYIYLRTESDRKALLKSIAIISLLSAIIGFLHFHFFYHIRFIDLIYATSEEGLILYLQNPSIMRFRETSVFFGPNVYGYMLVFGFICFYFNFFTAEKIKKPATLILLILVTCFFFYNILLTYSRSASILFIFFILWQAVRTKRRFFTLTACTGVLVAAVSTYLILEQRYALDLALNDMRFSKLIVALQILTESPLNLIIGAPWGDTQTRLGITFSDNLYGEIFLQGGVVLVALLCIFAIMMFKKIKFLKTVSDTGNKRFLEAASFSLIFFILFGLFSIPIAMMHNFNYLGFLLGSLAAFEDSVNANIVQGKA